MSKNPIANLSNEKLIKRREFLKGALIGIGIIWILLTAICTYIFFKQGLKNNSFVMFIPLFTLPATLLPLFINLSLLSKEIKSRKLN
jgi:hypothetical protein